MGNNLPGRLNPSTEAEGAGRRVHRHRAHAANPLHPTLGSICLIPPFERKSGGRKVFLFGSPRACAKFVGVDLGREPVSDEKPRSASFDLMEKHNLALINCSTGQSVTQGKRPEGIRGTSFTPVSIKRFRVRTKKQGRTRTKQEQEQGTRTRNKNKNKNKNKDKKQNRRRNVIGNAIRFTAFNPVGCVFLDRQRLSCFVKENCFGAEC